MDSWISLLFRRRTLASTKEELIDYAERIGAPYEVVENLTELEDAEEPFESIEDIWPDYPSDEDFFYSDDDDFN